MTTQDLITQLNALADLQIKHKEDLGGTWLAGRYLGRDKWEKNLLNAPFREAAEALANVDRMITCSCSDCETCSIVSEIEQERDQLRAELENVRNQWHIDLNDKVQLRAENNQLAAQLQVEFLRGNDFIEETMELRAELAEKGDKLQRALGDLESLPWASQKELGAEIKRLRAELDAAKATISNLETGMGLRIAAAEAQLKAEVKRPEN